MPVGILSPREMMNGFYNLRHVASVNKELFVFFIQPSTQQYVSSLEDYKFYLVKCTRYMFRLFLLSHHQAFWCIQVQV
jgi:hypothetical protein